MTHKRKWNNDLTVVILGHCCRTNFHIQVVSPSLSS
jgi:hypothetical protein